MEAAIYLVAYEMMYWVRQPIVVCIITDHLILIIAFTCCTELFCNRA